MQQEEGRDHEETAYGHWGWIGGFIIGGLLMWMMFAMATGFT